MAENQCILQDWVLKLGLRHQGALLTGIRGCDTVSRDHPTKVFVRIMRGLILKAHCGNAKQSGSFISYATPRDTEIFFDRMMRAKLDELPHHYVMHLIHCIQIVGAHHSEAVINILWTGFYNRLCKSLHVMPETNAQMDTRLNASEREFVREQE